MQFKHELFDIIKSNDVANEIFKYFEKYSDVVHILQTNKAAFALIENTEVGKQLLILTNKYRDELETNEGLKVNQFLTNSLYSGVPLLVIVSIAGIFYCNYSDDLTMSLLMFPITVLLAWSMGCDGQHGIELNNWNYIAGMLALLFTHLLVGANYIENHVAAYALLRTCLTPLGILTEVCIENIQDSNQKDYKAHSARLNSRGTFFQNTIPEKKESLPDMDSDINKMNL